MNAAATTAAHAKVHLTQTQKDHWPLIFLTFVLGASLLYFLAISPSLYSHLRSSSSKAGYILRSASPPRPAHIEDRALPAARATSLWLARWRYFYNRVLLYTVPCIDLNIGQVVVLAVYLAAMITGTFAQPEDQPKYQTLRAGRMAVAQLPFLFILATKNNILAICFGKSYAKLNFIHRFAGRCVFFCSVLHSARYFDRLEKLHKLDFRHNSVYIAGLAAFIAVTVILFTSFGFVRSYAYRFFLWSHVMGWLTFVIALWFHDEYCRRWIAGSVSFLFADYLLRLASTRIKMAVVSEAGGATQMRIAGIKSGWKAGQHVWIRILRGQHVFEAHPFTIANDASFDTLNASNDPRGLTTFAKACGNWTWDLYNSLTPKKVGEVEKADTTLKMVRVAVEGPYGSDLHVMQSFESVLFVAGGSGVTYALSALEHLIVTSLSDPRHVTRHIKVLYITRDLNSSQLFITCLNNVAESYNGRSSMSVSVEVFITSLSKDGNSDLSLDLEKKDISPGRPDLGEILEEHLNDSKPETAGVIGGGVLVATCGPPTLIRSVKDTVRHADRSLALSVGGIVVHSETFGW